MTERTMRQREDELDGFWNALVTGNTPQPASPESALVTRLATLDAAPPRTGFLDELWITMLVPETNGHLEVPVPPAEPAPVASVALRPAQPTRPVADTRSRIQRWGKVAAVIAALLAVAILANSRPELREKLRKFREEQTAKVMNDTLG